jgi:hypothetical protein
MFLLIGTRTCLYRDSHFLLYYYYQDGREQMLKKQKKMSLGELRCWRGEKNTKCHRKSLTIPSCTLFWAKSQS